MSLCHTPHQETVLNHMSYSEAAFQKTEDTPRYDICIVVFEERHGDHKGTFTVTTECTCTVTANRR